MYQQFLPYTQKLYIAKIHATFEGDRYFPEIAFSLWKEIYTEKGIQNDKNPYVNLPNHLVLFIH
ncbi:hypothetical protein COI93_18875 [Bacillus cereus]|uniref:DHFR domain-containing protein n=1 Tax=Bacillus cereus TaxID=1396 RepID=A0A2B0LMJ9_BACCE|nr:hypothetical protein COI93_18875 [Bacillus cereus]